MARKANSQPTDAELEILKILWDKGASSLGDICSAIRTQRPAATTTIATTLGVMHRKGLVKRASGPRGYLWSAALDRGTAASRAIRKLIDRVFDGSAQELVSHLIGTGRLKPRDLDEIQRLMDAYKNTKQG
jgi:predicted transcriptional regulator